MWRRRQKGENMTKMQNVLGLLASTALTVVGFVFDFPPYDILVCMICGGFIGVFGANLMMGNFGKCKCDENCDCKRVD